MSLSVLGGSDFSSPNSTWSESFPGLQMRKQFQGAHSSYGACWVLGILRWTSRCPPEGGRGRGFEATAAPCHPPASGMTRSSSATHGC